MENDISTNNSVKGIKSHHSCDFSVDRNEIIRLIFAWSEKDEGIFTYTITISSEASYFIRTDSSSTQVAYQVLLDRKSTELL